MFEEDIHASVSKITRSGFAPPNVRVNVSPGGPHSKRVRLENLETTDLYLKCRTGETARMLIEAVFRLDYNHEVLQNSAGTSGGDDLMPGSS